MFSVFWAPKPAQFGSLLLMSATQPCVAARSLPAAGVRERAGRVKVRKLVAWNKDSLVGIAKATHTSKVKQGIHCPLLTGKQG